VSGRDKVEPTYTYSLQDRYFSPGMQRQRHWENESTLHESPSVSVPLHPVGLTASMHCYHWLTLYPVR